MLSESKCFPSDWIGGKLVRENDWYLINGIHLVAMPSQYGKPVNAYWISNGVLVMESDTNNDKVFMVGTQRYFPAYGEETEPHDIKGYRAAVEECIRLRAEEKIGYGLKPDAGDNSKTDSEDASKRVDGNKTKLAIAGIGGAIREARSAINDFKKISDSSEFEADANKIVEDFIQKQELEMAEIFRRAEEEGKRAELLRNEQLEEVDRLKAIHDRLEARDRKKTIFSNLHNLFEKTGGNVYGSKMVCKLSGINDQEGILAAERVMNGYYRSLDEVGISEKFYQCWSEIFYLIEEGVMFKDEHVSYFTKVINNTCKPGKDENVESFDDYLKRIYRVVGSAFWGYCFAKHPKEDELKKCLSNLEWSILPEEDELNIPNLDNKYFSDEALGFVPTDKQKELKANVETARTSSPTSPNSSKAERSQTPKIDQKTDKDVERKVAKVQSPSSDSTSTKNDNSDAKPKKKVNPLLIFLLCALPFLILLIIAIISKSREDSDMDFDDSNYELIDESTDSESDEIMDEDLSDDLLEEIEAEEALIEEIEDLDADEDLEEE